MRCLTFESIFILKLIHSQPNERGATYGTDTGGLQLSLNARFKDCATVNRDGKLSGARDDIDNNWLALTINV
jgi:hypothetical protein